MLMGEKYQFLHLIMQGKNYEKKTREDLELAG